jgi:hypothetical protein
MKKLTGAIGLTLATLLISGCGNSGPLVLSLAANQQDSGENRAVADAAAVAPDFSGVTIDYLPVGDVGIVPTTAQAWSVAKFGEAMREIQRIADGLGLDARAKRSGYDKYVFVAEDKTTGASVTLWNHLAIGGWWSYSVTSGASVSSDPGCPPDDRTCVVPEPEPLPTNLLTEEGALARTYELLEKAKLRPKSYVLSAQRSDWSTDVYGAVQLNGISTNIAVTFSYGQDGVLQYASGPVMSFVEADMYPLVSLEAAIARLPLAQYSSFGTATGIAADLAVSETVNSDADVVPLTVAVTSVRLTLMESHLRNGTHILLPSFTFSNADGDVGTVIAVTDEYLEFPTVDRSPAPVPEPNPDGPVAPLTPESSQTLIGMTEDEASKMATTNGWAVRIAMRDGEPFTLTMDYRQDRVNLMVEKNLVTKVDIG